MKLLAALVAALALLPIPGLPGLPGGHGPRTALRVSPDGAWTARLAGVDLAGVASVTYYVRDAGRRWHLAGWSTAAPFEAPVPWWEWDDAGPELITSHVVMRDHRRMVDPGGWQRIDGLRSAGPGGSLTARVAAAGS